MAAEPHSIPDEEPSDHASEPTAAAEPGPHPNLAGEDTETAAAGEADQSRATEALYVEDILAAAEAEASDPSAEHLNDLKRITAEYANYRKRTEANRELDRERAVGSAVAVLLPVLDDLDRAQKHGDLAGDGPFVTIAAKLRAAVEKLGLRPFGAPGDAFDPQLHEAVFQQPDATVSTDTVADVVETGYYLGSSLLRVAKVVVKVPAE